MKKLLVLFLASALCVMMAFAVSAKDVYLNDGGLGDGSSAESPLGNMTAAIEAIADEGGKVIIVDTYTCADQYVEPAHAGDIVITGGKYVFAHGKYNRWYLSGEGSTTFENIAFEYAAGSTALFVAQFNKLVMGEGIAFTTKEYSGYVIGGYQKADEYATLDEMITTLGLPTDKNSDITVKSGSYHLVAGFNRGDDSARTSTNAFTGTSTIVIDGGDFKTVYGGNINCNATSAGTDITINGGNITGGVRAAGEEQVVAQVNGDATFTINGGDIATLVFNNVLGNVVVNANGGNITMANARVNAEGLTANEGSATLLKIGADAKISQMIADVFDSYEGHVYVPNLPVIPSMTEAVATAEAAPVATTAAAVDGGESAGAPVGLIIGIVAAVIVVAVVVVLVTKKKK